MTLRNTLIGSASVLLGLGCLGTSVAEAGNFFFQNPTAVNLLSRWDFNTGRYYYDPLLDSDALGAGDFLTFNDGSRHQSTVDYATAGNGYSVSKPGAGQTKTVTMRWTFDEPRTIDTITTTWRAPDHSTNNYTFRDQTGDIFTHAPGPRFGAGTITHNFGARTSNFLEFETTLDDGTGEFYHLMENLGMGAYLAPGQQLKMDGTYDIFFDPHTLIAGNDGGGDWTNHAQGFNGFKPVGTDGEVIYDLGQIYKIRGAMLTHFDSGRFLANATISVSETNLPGSYVTIYGPDTEWHFRGEAAPRELGYVVLDQFADGRFVKLEWSNNLNPVEITQFQVFGLLPEPASFGLLTLGGLAVLGRRRV